MKILHLVQFLGVGGLEKVLELLINEQKAMGHEVELMVYDHNQDWVEEFRSNGIKVTTDYQKKPGFDFKLISFLTSKVRGFDLVHTHDLNPMMYLGPARVLSKIKGHENFPKIVHTTHGMEHIDIEPRTIFYEKFIASLTEAVIGVSPAICSYYEKKLKVDPSKIYNIDNGTPVPKTLPVYKEGKELLEKRFSLPSGKKIFCSIARVVPLKDQKILVEAMKSFPDALLLIIGPSGNDQYYKELEEIKPSNVYLLGGQSKINEILSGVDLFLSASHHEGIPISVLEAQAAGVPCLLSDIPGHLTLKENMTKDVALYFKMKSLTELKANLNKFLSPNFNLEEIRETAYNMVKQDYSSKAMALNYQVVYAGTK
ncbi:MAG: glycosyltransferase involved in cell wall biosynthesis [Bacteriovoracaceae bacterium]|jgi:glycosyltransferase involved in cell wall biosynthesis